jgi:hypothetical protein
MAGITGKKIGLVWAGRPSHPKDRDRSIPLERLSPILNESGPTLFSLQKGGEPAASITDWTSELNDFADTAGLIQNLDLVVTVDTSVAHLAAAMGKPTWLLLAWVPDWRWMLGRGDSPWYPTLRLFRQPSIGDWETPINQVAEALKVL